MGSSLSSEKFSDSEFLARTLPDTAFVSTPRPAPADPPEPSAEPEPSETAEPADPPEPSEPAGSPDPPTPPATPVESPRGEPGALAHKWAPGAEVVFGDQQLRGHIDACRGFQVAGVTTEPLSWCRVPTQETGSCIAFALREAAPAPASETSPIRFVVETSPVTSIEPGPSPVPETNPALNSETSLVPPPPPLELPELREPEGADSEAQDLPDASELKEVVVASDPEDAHVEPVATADPESAPPCAAAPPGPGTEAEMSDDGIVFRPGFRIRVDMDTPLRVGDVGVAHLQYDTPNAAQVLLDRMAGTAVWSWDKPCVRFAVQQCVPRYDVWSDGEKYPGVLETDMTPPC